MAEIRGIEPRDREEIFTERFRDALLLEGKDRIEASRAAVESVDEYDNAMAAVLVTLALP